MSRREFYTGKYTATIEQREFQLSVESNFVFLWFSFAELYDWLAKLAPLFQPIRNETKINRASLARVFPRLAPVTCISFEF